MCYKPSSMILALAILSCATVAQAITIETVPVGNPGNVGEWSGDGSERICGAVNYSYNIGKYEVTAGQYTAFLNAVGGVDIYGLYNMSMAQTDYGSGIAQSGGGTVGNPFIYSVADDFVNRPVNYVSFWDAARFTNWLNNGQPTGVQGAGTTETGTYTLDGYNGNDGRTIQRNAGAKWVLPSEDEWYKAAYHDKIAGQAASYFDYPTSSNEAPGQDMADASGNNANHYADSYAYPIDSGKYTTLAGEFQNSDSPYGTFDQGGNVWEWNESVIYEFEDSSSRGVRGGSFNYNSNALHASNPFSGDPTNGHSTIGFRVASVPEPSTLAMLAGLALTALLCWRRKRA